MPEIPKRLLASARKQGTTKHQNKVANLLQKLVRAEAGAFVGESLAICDGEPQMVHTRLGECACVTCGRVHWFKGTRRMQGGHMLPGRNAHILLDETLVYPQCAYCNEWHSGAPVEFKTYAVERYGEDWYAAKKMQSRGYVMDGGHRKRHIPPTLEERVLLYMDFQQRLKIAEEIINAG